MHEREPVLEILDANPIMRERIGEPSDRALLCVCDAGRVTVARGKIVLGSIARIPEAEPQAGQAAGR